MIWQYIHNKDFTYQKYSTTVGDFVFIIQLETKNWSLFIRQYQASMHIKTYEDLHEAIRVAENTIEEWRIENEQLRGYTQQT